MRENLTHGSYGEGWKRIAPDADTAPVPYPTGVPQILEVQRRLGQVTHENNESPKQSRLPGDLRTFKLECMSIKRKLSPLALCRKLLINASRSAYDELLVLRATT